MEQILLANFGGPRDLDEVAPFLTELLCDRDVIRTRFPTFFHNFLFGRIAKKRALKVQHDYEQIGGRSPIYFDTENMGQILSQKLQTNVITFHRYLAKTHADTLKKVQEAETLKVVPLFPQFSTATTGSLLRFFSHLPPGKLQWIRSYADHPAFISAYQRKIAEFLSQNQLLQEETLLLFSAHGLPKSFVESGDIYEQECNKSFNAVMRAFTSAKGLLCYQSKFGRGEWLRPYTNEVCEKILHYSQGRKNVVFVPISFTTDHIETLFEVEKLYLPVIAAQGLSAYRCPALNLEPYWIDGLVEILQSREKWGKCEKFPS